MVETVNEPGKPDHRVIFSALRNPPLQELMTKILEVSTRNW